MTRRRPFALLAAAAVVPLSAWVIAGCGGAGDDSAGSSTPPDAAIGRPVTIGVGDGGLGSILVDTHGRTLYLFQKDTGAGSECSGACASAWPPLRADRKPGVAPWAIADMVGTTPRSDGKPQVTYNGHPLYRYEGDQKPGETNGQGLTRFGGFWYAVSPAGNQVSETASDLIGGPCSGY